MPPIIAIVDDSHARINLGTIRAKATDYRALLNIAGNIMRASISRTFREEGSPAGSWPRLAISTLRKKVYTTGHKLLILSGRLFSSIGYVITGNVLTIGTNLVYAAVHQFGSADRAGAGIGPQARILGREVEVAEHGAMRINPYRQYGTTKRIGKDGKMRTVRVRLQGPDTATRFGVRAHHRFQNIPPRPYLVFRPEDPQTIVDAYAAYFGAGSKNINMGVA
jgi:phage gpG-like protein